MAQITVYIDVDLDKLPDYAYEVVVKSIALKVAKGDLLDSNFDLPISRVGPYLIESGQIRRK
jgi:hypothetical protein